MFDRLSRGVTARPWLAIGAWVAILAIAAAGALWGFGHGGLFERMKSSASMVPGSESEQVHLITNPADANESVTLVVSGVAMPDDAQKAAAAVTAHRSDFTDIKGVTQVVDPFMFPNPQDPQALAFMSSAKDGFVISIQLDGTLSEDDAATAHDEVVAAKDSFQDELRADLPNAEINALSFTLVGDSINELVQKDLVRGESIGLPIALILMVLVFGGFLAAGLPLVGALVAIGIGMGVLWAVTFGMDLNSFVLNVVSIIGLALSIDYGLLVVSRYREEIADELTARGLPVDGSQLPDDVTTMVHDAVAATIRTAGRTVFFSALTIAFSIAGLLVFSSEILRSIALGGITVTVLAVASAITLVPALLVVLDDKLVKPSLLTRIPGLRKVTAAIGDSSSDHGGFSRLARFDQHHPWAVIIVITAILLFMAMPLRDLQVRSNFMEYMPKGSDPQIAYTMVQDDYPALASPEMVLIAETAPQQTGPLVEHIKISYPDVTYVGVQPIAEHPEWSRLDVQMDVADRVGNQAVDPMTELRSYDAGYPVLVGGEAAQQYDFVHSLLDRAPLAALIIVIAVFVLLFLMTGSLVVPIKTLLINFLSLAASLGATVWIFEGGHLGMPQTYGLETFIVACMLAFGFGLSMDYEVFLVARMKEAWDHGATNNEAVQLGLQRSGRIITSAAAIIIAVFLGFVAGEMLPIKQIGVGLAIMIATDATLVRLLLVPATMTVLGDWNWWAPKHLRTLYDRFKIEH